MSDFPEERDSSDDLNEDDQLTIRIPNPKMYMARQSLWIGRRGKPRCDYCRLNNLKCDRVLPACNHCSWASGRQCTYTPLPTPAHRGIPRCDRCRLSNLKCDRNLPVCNHCKDDGKTECNYTPKKRRKFPSDSSQITDMEGINTLNSADFTESNKFYGQNVASNAFGGPSASPDLSPSQSIQTGRFTAELQPSIYRTAVSSIPVLGAGETSHHPFTSHSYYAGHSTIQVEQIVPWDNPSFAPLPDFLTELVRSLKPADFPNPTHFNELLATFLEGLMPELQETSCLSAEKYALIYRCLSRGDPSNLSFRMRQWISYHHLCLGSDLAHLILAPRDSIFHTDETEREAYRRAYCNRVDKSSGKTRESLDVRHPTFMDDSHLFERLPVRDQVFDILTYAHATHDNSTRMLTTIRNMGFGSITWPIAELYVRTCPTCSHESRTNSRSIEDK